LPVNKLRYIHLLNNSINEYNILNFSKKTKFKAAKNLPFNQNKIPAPKSFYETTWIQQKNKISISLTPPLPQTVDSKFPLKANTTTPSSKQFMEKTRRKPV
jgi:hypothetical protein